LNDEWEPEEPNEPERTADPQIPAARRELEAIIDSKPDEVFYSLQLEIFLEDRFFDWITNRALHELIADRAVEHERREAKCPPEILLVWNRKNRYNRRRAKRVISLVEEYSDPQFSTLLGHQGQLLFENGMGRTNFRLLAENVNEWNGRKWQESNENLDYIYERDGIVYGVEVKNALGRIREAELTSKTAICEHLGVVPFFAVRWMPQIWIQRTAKVHNGFVLMLKWQLYPLSHAGLARTIREELGLPVDAPPRYHAKTLERIVKAHEKRVNSLRNSQ